MRRRGRRALGETGQPVDESGRRRRRFKPRTTQRDRDARPDPDLVDRRRRSRRMVDPLSGSVRDRLRNLMNSHSDLTQRCRGISGKVAARSGATFGAFGGPPCGVWDSDSVAWAQAQAVVTGVPYPAGPGRSFGAKRRLVSGAGVKPVTRRLAGWGVRSDRRAWKGR